MKNSYFKVNLLILHGLNSNMERNYFKLRNVKPCWNVCFDKKPNVLLKTNFHCQVGTVLLAIGESKANRYVIYHDYSGARYWISRIISLVFVFHLLYEWAGLIFAADVLGINIFLAKFRILSTAQKKIHCQLLI